MIIIISKQTELWYRNSISIGRYPNSAIWIRSEKMWIGASLNTVQFTVIQSQPKQIQFIKFMGFYVLKRVDGTRLWHCESTSTWKKCFYRTNVSTMSKVILYSFDNWENKMCGSKVRCSSSMWNLMYAFGEKVCKLFVLIVRPLAKFTVSRQLQFNSIQFFYITTNVISRNFNNTVQLIYTEPIQKKFLAEETNRLHWNFSLIQSPVLSGHEATVERNDSLLTGRNLHQNQNQ